MSQRLLSQGLVLPFAAPRSAPVRGVPALGDINGFAGYFVASEFEDADGVVPCPAVIADGVLRNPKITATPDPANLEFKSSGIHLPPGDEVLFADEALL